MRFKRGLVTATCAVILGFSTFTTPATAARTTVSENPADYTPHVIDGNINQYALVGTTMYAGGTINTVKSANGEGTYTRHNVMAFNAVDGHMLAFAPRIENGDEEAEVWGLEPTADGKYMFISGSFTTVDGIARRGVVKYDLVNKQVDTSFDAKLDARATVTKLVNGHLIIAGSFNKVGGTSRRALASVNPTTGVLTSYINLNIAGTHRVEDPTRIYRFSVNPANDRMILIGSFTSISGQSREQVAMVILYPTSTRLSGWNSRHFYEACTTSRTWYFRDVDWSDDGKWFVLVSATASRRGKLCDSASRWEWPSAQSNPALSTPTWVNYTGGDSLHSVTIVGNVVYVGGHQRWLNNNTTVLGQAGDEAVSRPGIGAISTLSGNAAGWNPTRTRGIGAKELYYTSIPGAHGLWVGSDTEELGHEYHASVGFFPQTD